MSTQENVEEAREKQFERSIHSGNLNVPQQNDDDGTAEILRYLSDIDDLPITDDDPIMGQLISKVTSTANLSPEEVKSNKWVREYLLLLVLCKSPLPDGMHRGDRAWAHDDLDAYREPISPERRAELEAAISMSNLALSRSEGGFATKESTRTVNESIVNDNKDNNSSGGLLGRFGR